VNDQRAALLVPARHRVGLLGTGIGGSLSPALHLREAAELGLDYRYERLDLQERPDLGVRAAVRAGYTGLNVTHPVKQTVPAELDELAPDARRLGAVNTVVVQDGRLIGHNTDHSGFLAGLRHGLPGASLRRVLVVGAGGAGSAVGYALLHAGARVRLADADPDRAEACAARLDAARPGADVAAVPLTPTAIAEADGVVNATPIGMDGYPGLPFDPAPLAARHWVAEVVYRPLHTELLSAARATGCRVLDGGAMLVAQAAGTLALLTGARPDLDRMRRHLIELTTKEGS
jgi:shikimate dehydrogenase